MGFHIFIVILLVVNVIFGRFKIQKTIRESPVKQSRLWTIYPLLGSKSSKKLYSIPICAHEERDS